MQSDATVFLLLAWGLQKQAGMYKPDSSDAIMFVLLVGQVFGAIPSLERHQWEHFNSLL